MLQLLKQQGHRIAVVSNKYDDAVKELCKKYFKDLIEIAIGEGYGVQKKPAPDGIIKVLEKLNVQNKENVIYVGDSEVDIQTAKNAEILCVSVLWGFKDKDFLEANGAKLFAKTPNDIISLL